MTTIWLLYVNGFYSTSVNGYVVARDNAIRISYSHDNTVVDIVSDATGEVVASYYGGLRVREE